MKRVLSVLLTVVLLLTMTSAFAVSYTMPEKMQRQLEFGSGLKGSFTINVTGASDIAARFGFLNGREYQIRGLTTEGETQYLLYCEGENETQPGLTKFWNEKDGTASWLESELLPGRIIEFPAVSDIPLRLAGFGEDDNPPFYGLLLNFLEIPEDEFSKSWEPVLKEYYSWTDMWLSSYADAPTVDILDGGETVLKIAYQIPSKAVRNGVNELIGKVLKDEKMTALLGTIMTEAEKETYLNPNYAAYYQAALESLAMEGSVTLNRTVSVKGEQRSMKVSFPLSVNEQGWETLEIDETDKLTTWSLHGQEKVLSVCITKEAVTADSSAFGAFVRFENTGADTAETICADVSFTRMHSNNMDSENREHDTTTFTLSVTPAAVDPAGNTIDGQDFAPVTVKGELHFSSKNAPNSPTTLTADINADWQDTSLNLAATLKTSSPWVLQKFSHDGAESLMAMSDENKLALLNEFLDQASAFFGTEATAGAAADTEAPAGTGEGQAVETADEAAEGSDKTGEETDPQELSEAADEPAESEETPDPQELPEAAEEPADAGETTGTGEEREAQEPSEAADETDAPEETDGESRELPDTEETGV